ncbi:MAG: DUF5320 domain-containing protein [Candidatus Diapherotrites archaeon]
MPFRDGTGPLGRGTLTGKGFGPCGRGFAFRRGLSRFSFSEPITLTQEEQKKILEEEIKEIEAEKKAIEKKLEELKE